VIVPGSPWLRFQPLYLLNLIFYAGLDPHFDPDAGPDSDPSFQSDADPDPLSKMMRIYADPDPLSKMMRIYADPDLVWRKCTFLSFVSLRVAGRDYAYILFRGFFRGQFSNYSRVPERDNIANKYSCFPCTVKLVIFVSLSYMSS
jgi:hypothetical protein